jgi:haloalkane dehalogenase
MKALRTPDARFEDLPGYNWAPHYLDDLPGYEGVRVHRIDEGGSGDPGQPTFLCLHGQPTWCYLYRRMIPVFLKAGGRVVAPDLLGFGRSDKPVEDSVYSFDFHRNMLLRLIERLDLGNITLVVQDWGGLLGLTLPMEMEQRFSRLIIMNTTLATGVAPGDGFMAWKAYAAANPDLAIGRLMKRSCPHLTDAEVAAYDAPWPDVNHKAGVRRFPEMVMISPEMDGVGTSKRAVKFWRDEWKGRSFMAIGAQDPVLGIEPMLAMKTMIRRCPQPLIVEQAGHFVQEWGEAVAEAALNSFASPD